MKPNNKNKTPEIDESILDEAAPNINEPQEKEDDPENKESDTIEEEGKDSEKEEIPEKTEVDVEQDEKVEEKQEIPQETSEQKEQRYKAQQTEAQIQAAKNRALIEKVDSASTVDVSVEEVTAYLAKDGVAWDELTTFEQTMARKAYVNEKRFLLISDAVESTKKIDEWATKVDTFIDSTDGKPEYIGLSGHEADFRKYSMKEAHRGTPIEVLLGAFLHNLPPTPKKKGSLFETGSGGEKTEKPGKITDADTVANLRVTNPREYQRLIKAGKISLDI